ncbi:MAG: hypothetical protein EPN84_11695 [Legionella sp.]|nr:MAG: hypothetical protein EPN84_11695 [Legionella sp.]
MPYSSQNVDFRRDKQQFFTALQSKNKGTEFHFADTKTNEKNYGFLLQNKLTLEAELSQLFASLKKQNAEYNNQFWFYCYYCASLLEAYYKAYGQQIKMSEFTRIKAQIKDRVYQVKKPKEEDPSFAEALRNKFMSSLSSLADSPNHISQIRDNVAFANLCRLYWVFCRLTLVQGLRVAKDLELIDKLDVVLGTHTDIDKIIGAIQAPNGVLNYFSVGLFAFRLVVDGGLLIKHTFFPSDEEKDEMGATAWDRFKHELYKRHCNFANDFVWAVVNFLTNFNHISGIPGAVTGYITAVFLVFDICLLLYRNNLAKEEYLAKKSQYLEELKYYNDTTIKSYLSEEQRRNHITMLNRQLIELEMDWRTKEATFLFAATAAALLFAGFTLALLVSSPVIIFASYFVCQVAVAMYLSTGAYSQFSEKSLLLEQANLTGENLNVARKEYEIARNDFIFAMVKNTVMPSLLIATYAICWPAAIALTVLYMGHELLHAYNQYGLNAESKLLAATAPNDFAQPSLAPAF